MTFADPDAELNKLPPNEWQQRKSIIVRGGVIALIVGVGICIIGAIMISQRNPDVAMAGDWVHKMGMLVMLASMVTVLVGLRCAQIYKVILNSLVGLVTVLTVLIGLRRARFFCKEISNMLENLSQEESGDQQEPNPAKEVFIDTSTDFPRQRSMRPARPDARFQFSLSTFMICCVGVSVACGLLFGLPIIIAGFVYAFASLVMVVAIITVVVYGQGYLKTFCIGALVVLSFIVWNPVGGYGMMMVGVGFGGRSGSGEEIWVRLFMMGLWVATFIAGLVAVVVRFLVERPAKKIAKSSIIETSNRNAS